VSEWPQRIVPRLGHEPGLEPHVDRALGELWAISDEVIGLIREDAYVLKFKASAWQPAPMPPDYIPKRGDFT
jgi:hypothetical protein